MKNIILKITLIIFAVSSITTSCTDDFKEDFLNQTNPNEIDKDNFWRNLKETQKGLNATYKTLYDPAIINKINEMLRSDMGYPGYGRPTPQNTEPFYLQTYTASTDEVNEMWQSNYTGIFRANQVIEGLEKIKNTVEDQDEWTSQMAQARFFRGLFHYYLYTMYNNGKIIIRDATPKVKEDYNKPVSPASEVLAFIRTDLEYAYKNLYKKGEYPDGDVTKVTAGAAGTILGQTYLNELMYTEAMVYFEDVINNHGYTLETDLNKMFTTAGEYNSESILEINFTSDFVNLNLSPWTGESGTNWLNVQTSNTQGAVGPAWIAYEYKSESMDPLDSRNYYEDSTGATKLRNVPLRASAMMAIPEDNQTTYYLTGSVSEYPRFNSVAWGFAWWKKFTNHDIAETENQIPTGRSNLSAKNVTLNRLSEVILMQAECKIKTGDLTEAIKLMNKIRQRWGLVLLGKDNGDTAHTYDDITYDNTTLMRHLTHVEKPLELGAEGHAIRFLDFQRWKKSDNYGFKDRLKELSEEVFYGENFVFTNQLGKTTTKWYVSLTKTPSGPINEPEKQVVDYEYDLSYLNYNEDVHGSYPVPFRETNANPNINN